MDLVWLAAVAYFVPAVVAVARRHRSAAAILGLNLLLGWTVLGWVVALLWALRGSWRQHGGGL